MNYPAASGRGIKKFYEELPLVASYGELDPNGD
jgi:hypothetical protein